MSTFKRFEEIQAWQAARIITKKIYSLSSCGMFAKDFGFKDQIRRSSVSIMSNIAEGFERDGNGEFVQFLSVAKASAGELRSQLYVALDAEYLSKDVFLELFNEAEKASKMIGGLMKYLSGTEILGKKKDDKNARKKKPKTVIHSEPKI